MIKIERNSSGPMKRYYQFLKILCPLILNFIIQQSVFANNYSGSEITYKQLDSFRYELTFNLYRNCVGTSFTNPSSNAKLRSSCGTSSLSLTLISIEEVSQLHDTLKTQCNPPNTYGTGQGMERHVYRDTIDLNSSAYSAHLSCCNLIVDLYNCCRNSNISTINNPGTYFNYAEIRRCAAPLNSSPVFGFEPVFNFCQNQGQYFNVAALDTVDFDSLSFSIANPLNGLSSSTSYNTPCGVPFHLYYPGSLTCPTTYPNANPPIGFYMNPETGDIIFTPTTNEFTVLVVEVKEWRKDSNGTYQHIGTVRSDIDVLVSSCPSNNRPTLDGPFSYNVCAGEQLCFNITTEDDVYVPPPPATSPAEDTTIITWNGSIPGATFTIVNPNARERTGMFCWTPNESDARSLPYQFVAEVKDNQNRPAITRLAYQVRVKTKARTETTFDSLGCGFFEVSSNPDSAFKGTPSYQWEVMDTSGNYVLADKMYFLSNTSITSFEQKDTIKFKEPGMYIIQHTVNNSPHDCPTIYYDTIVAGDTFRVDLDISDTAVCPVNTMSIKATVQHTGGTPQYEWFKNGTLLSGRTSDTLIIPAYQIGSKDTFQIYARSSAVCYDRDAASIEVHGTFITALPEIVESCVSPVDLTMGNIIDSILWSTGHSDTSDITVTSSRLVSYLAIDQHGCSYSDSSKVFVYQLVPLQLSDNSVCDDSLEVSVGSYDLYNWSTGASGNAIVLYKTEYVKLTVTDSNGCQQKDSAQFEVFGSTDLQLHNDTAICCLSSGIGTISLLGPNDPKTGIWSNHVFPASIQSGIFRPMLMCADTSNSAYLSYYYKDNQTQCEFHDSIKITVNPNSQIILSTGQYCSSDSEIDLIGDLFIQPSMPDQSSLIWSCVECNGNQLDDILINKGDSINPEYWLAIDTNNYSFKHSQEDTIRLAVSLDNEFGCGDEDTTSIILTKNPAKPQLFKVNEFIYIINPSFEVQWYRDSQFIAQNTDSIDATLFGTYTARNVNERGCLSEYSDEIDRGAGLQHYQLRNLSVMPNPNTGRFILILPSDDYSLIGQLRIYNQQGQLVEFEFYQNGRNVQIDLHASGGTYFLEFIGPDYVYRVKIIKI